MVTLEALLEAVVELEQPFAKRPKVTAIRKTEKKRFMAVKRSKFFFTDDATKN